jgi:hypothetical protein
MYVPSQVRSIREEKKAEEEEEEEGNEGTLAAALDRTSNSFSLQCRRHGRSRNI